MIELLNPLVGIPEFLSPRVLRGLSNIATGFVIGLTIYVVVSVLIGECSRKGFYDGKQGMDEHNYFRGMNRFFYTVGKFFGSLQKNRVRRQRKRHIKRTDKHNDFIEKHSQKWEDENKKRQQLILDRRNKNNERRDKNS